MLCHVRILKLLVLVALVKLLNVGVTVEVSDTTMLNHYCPVKLFNHLIKPLLILSFRRFSNFSISDRSMLLFLAFPNFTFKTCCFLRETREKELKALAIKMQRKVNGTVLMQHRCVTHLYCRFSIQLISYNLNKLSILKTF